jgi:hypothetical protein
MKLKAEIIQGGLQDEKRQYFNNQFIGGSSIADSWRCGL